MIRNDENRLRPVTILLLIAGLIALLLSPCISYIGYLKYRELTEDTSLDIAFNRFGGFTHRFAPNILGSERSIYGVRLQKRLDPEVARLFNTTPKCHLLYLDGCSVDIESLKNVLDKCPINSLFIANTCLDDTHFSNCIDSLNEIQDLYIRDSDISIESLNVFIGMKRLRSITIWNTLLSDDDIELIKKERPTLKIVKSSFR